MDRLLALVAVAGAACAVALALAPNQPKWPGPAKQLTAVLDGDGDGAVSPAEYARASDGALPFAILDADESGALEPWELEVLLTHISPLVAQKNSLPRVR